MSELILEVPLAPVGKPRPRFGRGRTYNQSHAGLDHFVLHLTTEARAKMTQPIIADAIQVHWTGVFPMTKLEKKKASRLRHPHTKKPDVDNCTKTILDALTGIVWVDDSLVYHVSAWKFIARHEEEPRTSVKIVW